MSRSRIPFRPVVCEIRVSHGSKLIDIDVYCIVHHCEHAASAGVVSGLPAASAGSPDTTLAEPHPNSKTQHTKNVTANVVVQQHSRKLPKRGILMPETCWVSKKKNKISKLYLIGFLFFS